MRHPDHRPPVTGEPNDGRLTAAALVAHEGVVVGRASAVGQTGAAGGGEVLAIGQASGLGGSQAGGSQGDGGCPFRDRRA